MRSIPEPVPSVALSASVTGAVMFQPLALGAGVSCAVTVGAVVSTTIAVLAAEAVGVASPSAQTVCAPSALLGIVSRPIVAVPAGPTVDGEPVSAVAPSRR